MQAFSIENDDQSDNLRKLPYFIREKRVLLYAFAASLGFLSTGYHLSVLNSSVVFLWLGCSQYITLYEFKGKSDAYYIFSAFLTAMIISLNKIKFRLDHKFLIGADVLMIFSTLAIFTIFSEASDWILAGRAIAGVAAGINITIILSFVREIQFFLSDNKFKNEKRRFFIDSLFALGIFLGFIPSQLFSEVKKYGDFLPEQLQPEDLHRPEKLTCLGLCFIPVAASIARTVLLVHLGEVTQPEYAPIMDEDFSGHQQGEEETGKLYMFKFKESRSLMKLLKPPYKVRLGMCCALMFSQLWSGSTIFTTNLLYLARGLKDFYALDGSMNDVQFTVFIFGCVYLLANALPSLALTQRKLRRRRLMYFGTIGGGISLLIIIILTSMNDKAFLVLLGVIYYFCINVGMGPAVELFYEEVLPAKGVQFLAAFKWLVLGVFSLGTGYCLRHIEVYGVLCFALFVMCVMLTYAVYDIIPETGGVEAYNIYKLFRQGREEDERAEKATEVSREDSNTKAVVDPNEAEI